MLTLILEYAVVSLYMLCLGLIVLYSFGQLHLVITFYKNRGHEAPRPALTDEDELPFVTIQLPIYNELYVVERLLEAASQQDYPKDRFEIQLLDDSDDDTVEVAAKKVAELSERGIQITHVRRPTFDHPRTKSEGESGSKHHVNDVKVRDLKLNGGVSRPQPFCITVSPCRTANTSQKSCFGECCVRTRTFASDTDFFRAKQAAVDGQ